MRVNGRRNSLFAAICIKQMTKDGIILQHGASTRLLDLFRRLRETVSDCQRQEETPESPLSLMAMCCGYQPRLFPGSLPKLLVGVNHLHTHVCKQIEKYRHSPLSLRHSKQDKEEAWMFLVTGPEEDHMNEIFFLALWDIKFSPITHSCVLANSSGVDDKMAKEIHKAPLSVHVNTIKSCLLLTTHFDIPLV